MDEDHGDRAGPPGGSGDRPSFVPRHRATPHEPAPATRPVGTNPLGSGDPRAIGEYAVLAQLGVGGMGTVYLGRTPDGRPVAIKVVHPHLATDREFRGRFAHEVKAGRRVPGFCTAKVLDWGDHDGRPYLVTEYIDGIPLSRLVAEDGPFDPTSLHALALGTIAGLAAIHGVGLVHRDVKPSNVIVTLGGVRIIDFGIARALDDTGDYTRTGVVMGSLGWVAPEQLDAAPASPAMDIFGWGCLICFAATGRHPFTGSDINARVWNIQHGEPDLAGVPAPLRALVAAALRRDPSARPAAPGLLLSVVGAAPVDDPTTTTPRFGRLRQRRSVGLLAAAVPLAAALVVGAAGAADFKGNFDNGGPNGTPPSAPGAPGPQQTGVASGKGGASGTSGHGAGASGTASPGVSGLPVTLPSLGASEQPAPSVTQSSHTPNPNKPSKTADLGGIVPSQPASATPTSSETSQP